MRILNLFNSKIFKKISKLNLALFVVGGTSYYINKNIKLNTFQIPQYKSFVLANAATNRSDQIKSFNFIADVVETITPSVVSITVSSFLGTGFGSGFIVDESGYILTNAHVVTKNPYVSVTLFSGQKYQGEVIAIDRTSDLALIKINSPKVKLHPLEFAEISKLRAGEFVIALGSPMTLSNTVTVGVISAVERDLGHSKGLRYIQTDAIITVGNSGGPLVNLNGQVVGVNTMMVSTGFGFAIPGNHCKHFIKLAMSSGRPGMSSDSLSSGDLPASKSSGGGNKYMGIVMGSLTPQMVYENRMNNPDYVVQPNSGVVIHSVFNSSPAQKSGILPGDIVESVNGIIIHSTAELTNLIAKYDKLDLVLIRKGQRLLLKNIVPELF